MQIRFASDKLEEGQLETAFSNALPNVTSATSAISQARLVVSRTARNLGCDFN